MSQIWAGPTIELVGFAVLVIATVLTVVSGLAYVRAAWPMLTGR